MNRMQTSALGFLILALLSCSPATPPAYLSPVPTFEKVQDKAEDYIPMVDILFVIDDSGSMDSHQTDLATNIGKFTSVFLNGSVLDYNIGVITTTAALTQYDPPDKNCCGRMVGKTKVVNKATPLANQVLAENIMVGTSGDSYEKVFDPVYLALTEPNLSGANKGFLRRDATLVLIFITDAEDQSEAQSGNSVYNLMLKLKGGDTNKVLAYGAIVPSNDNLNCTRDQGYTKPVAIEAFLAIFSNRATNTMNLCDPDFGNRLAGLAQDIVANSGRVILLKMLPAKGSISVTYGTMDLPEDADTGWIYDPSRNAVVLGKNINWKAKPLGSKLKVYYNTYKGE
jgi:hypothetical protein